jgi:hypothetical protein
VTKARRVLLSAGVGICLLAAVVAIVVSVAASRRGTPDANRDVVFYGRLVDQHGSGIPGVPIVGHLIYQGSPQRPGYLQSGRGRQTVSTTTDARGSFVIRGPGESLDIEPLQLDGFTGEEPQWVKRSFAFRAESSDPHLGQSPNDPFVYHFWRKGSTEKLIIEWINSDVPRDGRPCTVDLLKRTSQLGGEGGDVRVAVTAPDPPGEGHTKFDWSFTIEAADGGLLETRDRFLFLAPEGGYRARYDYRVSKADPDGVWTNDLQRRFYLRSRKGSIYAALSVGVKPDFRDLKAARVHISYVANPAGSRNLEVDPMKKIYLP